MDDRQTKEAANLERNLRALQPHQPVLAEILQLLTPPAEIEAVAGRDGAWSYRWPTRGGNNHYLGASSMPTISSAALLANFTAGAGNVLLPTLGHGYEARRLLEQLGSWQAIFTFDFDPVVPWLALRLHDFSAALTAGRLVLLVGPDLDTAIEQAFVHYPLHLPPTRLFSPPQLDSASARQMQSASERALARRETDLNNQWQKLRADVRSRTASAVKTPLLLLSGQLDGRCLTAVRGLARAAVQMQIEYQSFCIDRPQHVHPLALGQAVRDKAPRRIIELTLSSTGAVDLIDTMVGRICWQMDTGLITPGGQRLGPAIDGDIFRTLDPQEIDPALQRVDVTIIQDALLLQPESAGLKWDSHRQLFERILAAVRIQPRLYSQPQAEKLLLQTCAASQIHLDNRELEQLLVRLISDRLAPTIITMKLCRLLGAAGLAVRIGGRGWPAEYSASAQITNASEATIRNQLYNTTALVIHVGQEGGGETLLLEAASAGAAILVPQSANNQPDDRWIFPELINNCPAFHTWPAALQLIRDWLSNNEKRNRLAEMNQKIVRENHLFQNRLGTLMAIT
ncbi:MAG: hypothetical protein HJJLKODD_02011 [Phycisphaerae bacterium]|nr:hypothetical protein [Phycisphaerae bacterium]